DAPVTELGPRRFELRRLPARRDMYGPDLFPRFVDAVNPFEIAGATPSRGWRSMINPLFGAFAVDVHADLTSAWKALHKARAAGAPASEIERLEAIFYSMPTHILPDGTALELNAENYSTIRNDWRNRPDELRLQYTAFFRSNYEQVRREAKVLIAQMN
ncbi:MAG: hypothetical protein VYC34_04980, partial [Planctomycetota bacterium]|nr:hypothetical protein [Planctomycetota bacterium]